MESLYFAIRQLDRSSLKIILPTILDINVIPEGESQSALVLSINIGFYYGTRRIFSHPSLRVENLYSIPQILVHASQMAPVDVMKKIAQNKRIPVRIDWYYGEHSALQEPIYKRDFIKFKWLLYLRGDEFDEYHTVDECEKARLTTAPDEFLELALKFFENPTKTKHELALELEPECLAAYLYGLVIFNCDGLLCAKADIADTSSSSSSRFFYIASKLPMDLQMLLCNRAYGISRDNIPSKLSEPAFKDIAKDFHVQS